jgi:hypothetical protein
MKTRIGIVSCLGLCACGLLSMASSCTITVRTPASAISTDTQTAAMPAGASLVVSNELGTTRVTVDPAATEATMQISRIAYAASEADAEDLLADMQVVVTAPTAGDNRLVIIAAAPPQATDDQTDFDMSVTGDDVVISAVFGNARVAKYRLTITLPPGHAVEATQTAGLLRATGLDTASTLSSEAATVRCIAATAAMTIDSKAGSVFVTEHAGSLNVDSDASSVSVGVASLAADESLTVHVDAGSISMDLPAGVDADLEAAATVGLVSFDKNDFTDVTIDVQTMSYVRVQLNDGGPIIDLSTTAGGISIN